MGLGANSRLNPNIVQIMAGRKVDLSPWRFVQEVWDEQANQGRSQRRSALAARWPIELCEHILEAAEHGRNVRWKPPGSWRTEGRRMPCIMP